MGQKYYSAALIDGDFYTIEKFDTRGFSNNTAYDIGNYFHTKDDAKQVCDKLRAVLRGADVIETPSNEETIASREQCMKDDVRTRFGNILCYNDFYVKGWMACLEWFKSKILK